MKVYQPVLDKMTFKGQFTGMRSHTNNKLVLVFHTTDKRVMILDKLPANVEAEITLKFLKPLD